MSTTKEKIVKEKHCMIPRILASAGVDAWMVVTREDSDPVLPLVLGEHLVMDTALIFTPHGSTAVLGHISMSAGHGRLFDRVVEYTPGKLEDSLVPLLKEMDPKVLALNFSESDHTSDGLSLGLYRRLQRALGTWLAGREASAEDIVAELRGTKSASEIELLEAAARITMDVSDGSDPASELVSPTENSTTSSERR
ncbi:MAG: hypothetical protein Q8P31_05545 [Bacillota bacterium]|nr:hypothetical protein [Bacillota bacterium]